MAIVKSTPKDRRIRKFPQIQHEGNGGNISEASEAALGVKWEGQPGPYDLRNKKIQAHDQFSQDLNSMIDTEMETVMSFLRQMRDELEETSASTVDTAWAGPILRNAGYRVYSRIKQVRQKTVLLTKHYMKEQHLTLPKKINWENLCYDGDEKALEDRVIKIFEKYAWQLENEGIVRPDTLMFSLAGLMFRIMDTESMYLSNHLLALVEPEDAQFGEYVSGENCVSHDPLGVCDQYCNGIHSLATLRLNVPPFHPHCHCFAIYYTIDELNDSNKEEKEE